MSSILEAAISKSFGDKSVLDNIHLQCNTGEIVGIFGRNGSGKSTLLKILFGTITADTMKLTIDGQSISGNDVIKKQLIGYLPQDNFLPKNCKVRDIIPMYFTGDEQDKVFYAPRIDKIAHTKAGNLSMGEVRYLELLLVGNLSHPFLMLDEPFSMVEPLYKELIKDFLTSLKTKKGILSTDHYYEDVFSITDRNVMLGNGKLTTVITRQDLATNGYLPAAKLSV